MLFKKKKETCCGCSCSGKIAAESSGEISGDMPRDKVLILGTGCRKCNQQETNVRKSLEELNLNLDIGHVTDFAQIASYGVMSTPALVIDGKVVSSGKVLSVDEIKKFFA